MGRSDVSRLYAIQSKGSDFADEINLTIFHRMTEHETFDFLKKHVPYEEPTIESFSWCSGFWSCLSGRYAALANP